MSPDELPRRLLPHQAFPDWLGEDVAGRILAFALDNQALFKPRRVGTRDNPRLDPTVRNSLGLRDLGPFAAMLRAAALRSLDDLGSGFGLRAEAVRHVELELVAHNDGAFYKVHSDVINDQSVQDHGVRRITMVYYFHRLPRAFAGGALRLHSIDRRSAFLDVAAVHDLMVAFPSFAPHSVEPVECPSGAFADSRFAINLWLRG